MFQRVDVERTTAIQALLTEFCWCTDNDRGDLIADLFTEDATVEAPHFRYVGRAEIAASFSARSGTKLSRHCWTNLRVERLADDRYRVGTNMITTVGALPAPQQCGRMVVSSCVDEIIFTENGRALFASRTLQIAFEGVLTAGEVAA